MEIERTIKVRLKTMPGYDLPLPAYMTEGAAGIDLMAAGREEIILEPGAWALIPTGISISIPAGYEAQIRPRSGLALKHGITLLNTPGTIDSDYRGEIRLIMINLGKSPYVVKKGERVAQMVFAPVVKADFMVVEELDATSRGDGGFGHTGRG